MATIELTGAEITQVAEQHDYKVKTVIPNQFDEIEFLAVSIKPFVTAFFKMNNDTFKYSYSHTYNATTDKTTKKTPVYFKNN